VESTLAVRKPRALRAGDEIRIVSPASPLDIARTANAAQLLEKQGYKVSFSRHAWESEGYLAGSDEKRAADLMEAFDDPDVAMVFCARGGYGCARLFPYLDLDRMAASGKLFAGFSDITTLHAALNRRGLPTLHAPMPLTLNTQREAWVYDSFLRALQGDLTVPESAPRARSLNAGVAEGTVAGGCLCLLADSIGTPDEVPIEGAILLIEDVDENPHRVDAMLTHFLNSGRIQRAAGIVVGEMTRTDEKVDEGIGGLPWREIVSDRLANLGVPVMIEYPFGHMPNMLTLGLGIRGRMDADAGTLEYLEPLCRA
jgi:muramoyltetrapeptide carboxypeptidase